MKKIRTLIRDLGFRRCVLGDNSGVWYEKDFLFDDIKFSFGLDFQTKKFYISQNDQDMSSEELFIRDLEFESFIKTLQKWEII